MNRGMKQTMIKSVLVAGLAGLAAGCATNAGSSQAKEQRVTVSELSVPARATVEKMTAGGKVDQIDKEVERGKVVYDVEATVAGKHVEYLIADVDGAVLGTEVSIEYSELPEPVRLAAEKYFDSKSGLKAMKGIEYGETHYEIEGPKNGKTVEATFDPAGRKGK
jgi:uncharacterized membrane protein YkoI